jgi:hypothetical protein
MLWIEDLTFISPMSISSEIGFLFGELLFSGDLLRIGALYGLLLSLEFLNGDV